MSPVSIGLDLIPLFPTQTEEAIYTRLAEWANEGLAPTDARWVDSREGSIFWTLARPLARELATLYDRAGTEVPSAVHPLYAWSTYLDDLALVYNLVRLPATAAGGVVQFYGDGGEVIAAGTVVGVTPAGEDTPQPTFAVGAGGTIPAPILPPTGFSATPVVGGGAFAAGTYYWVITALNANGETLSSAQATATIAASGRANLAWAAVAGATGYKIYRSTVSLGQGTTPSLVASVAPSTAYTDNGAAPSTGATPAVNTTAPLSLGVTATDPGVEGNTAAGSVTEPITPLALSVTVNNALPIVGGTDTETDEGLRERLLGAFQPKGAGTRADYQRWALAWPGVGRATVVPIWNGPGTVKVIVATATGAAVSPGIVTALQAYLDPVSGQGAGIAPVGHIVTVETGTTIGITITTNLALRGGYTLDGSSGTVAIRAALESAIALYLRTVEPGEYILVSRVVAALVEVYGVQDVNTITINGVSANFLVPLAPPRLPVLTALTPTII